MISKPAMGILVFSTVCISFFSGCVTSGNVITTPGLPRDTSGITDGQILEYDSASGLFKPGDDDSGAGSSFGNIENGTATGQMTYWDDTAGEWNHTETSELYWDDSNKRVGIGTSSPDYILDVDGEINSTALSTYYDSDDKWNILPIDGILYFYSVDTAAQTDKLYIFGNTANNNVDVIVYDGKLGVQDSTPGVELEVEGSITYSGTLTDDSDSRIKEVIGDIPEDNIISLYENLSFVRYYLYDYWEDGNGSYVRGNLTSNMEIGLIAQTTYNLLVDQGYDDTVISSLVRVGNATQVWGINYVGFSVLNGRMSQINHFRIKNMEHWAMQLPGDYAYDPGVAYG